MQIKSVVLAVLLWVLSPSSAMAVVLQDCVWQSPNPCNGLVLVGSIDVTDTFSENTRPPWHAVTGDYMITSGDPLPIGDPLPLAVRGADGKYLRVPGRDCSNFFPTDCDQSGGVSSYVDLAKIAGPATAYRVSVSFDVVAEGDMDGEFFWDIPDIQPRNASFFWPAHWDGGSLDPRCIRSDPNDDDNCLEYQRPFLDYASGPQTVGRDFVVIDQSGFTQEFFSTERYGFWAIDGFWGIDNLWIRIDSYSTAPVVVDPPTGNVPEPATLLLMALGLVGLCAIRRSKKDSENHLADLPPPSAVGGRLDDFQLPCEWRRAGRFDDHLPLKT